MIAEPQMDANQNKPLKNFWSTGNYIWVRLNNDEVPIEWSLFYIASSLNDCSPAQVISFIEDGKFLWITRKKSESNE